MIIMSFIFYFYYYTCLLFKRYQNVSIFIHYNNKSISIYFYGKKCVTQPNVVTLAFLILYNCQKLKIIIKHNKTYPSLQMKRIDLLLKKVGLVPVTNHPLMASTTHTVFVFAYISNVFFPSLFPHLNILKGTNKIHMIEDCLTRFHSHRISFIFRPTFRRSSRSEQGLSHRTSTHFFFRF